MFKREQFMTTKRRLNSCIIVVSIHYAKLMILYEFYKDFILLLTFLVQPSVAIYIYISRIPHGISFVPEDN